MNQSIFSAVTKFKGDDPGFVKQVALLEDEKASDEERKMAEKIVKEAVDEFGIWIGHGDLLTVKMVQEARASMAGSATLFGKLGFLGPIRLQLLHMKMKKVVQDMQNGMKSEINFDDVLSVPWSAALTRTKVTNKGKDIKKNDSTFERHDQFLAAVQTSYLLNLFDNFHGDNPEKIAQVSCLDDVIVYILEMLESYNIQLFYEPGFKRPSNDGEDDLFVYCQVSISFDYF